MTRFLRAAVLALPLLGVAAALTPLLPLDAQTARPAAAPGTSIRRLAPAVDRLIAPGARIEKIASGFIFVEGPLWRNGALYFSDLRGNSFNRLDADGKVTRVLDASGGLPRIPDGAYQGSNGAANNKDGNLLLAQHGARRIVSIDGQGRLTPYIERFEGKRINSPNDMAFHPDGSLWITDPPYGLLGQDKDPAKEVPFNAVYRYANGKLTAVIRDLTRPNGIGFSPDGKTLYISNCEPEMFVNAYPVLPGGRVGPARRIITYPKVNGQMPPDVPDGLKVDSAGNVWTSGPGGIRIITPAGGVIGQLVIPEVAANIAWGGPDLKTAYIMGSTSIYRLRLNVAGLRAPYQR